MGTTRFRNARCLITGASSGLGRALSIELALHEARLVLTGRSRERLDETAELARAAAAEAGLAPPQITCVLADLTVHADRERLFAVIGEVCEALELVVNSAGVGAYGSFESHAPETLERLFAINVLAAADLCRRSLPFLREGNQPALVNMGSIAGRRGLPGRSEYSATKFALAGFTEAIRAEWRVDGIHVLLANPGFTQTPFEQHVLEDTAFVKTASKRRQTADAVARRILWAVHERRNELVLTAQGRWLLRFNRWLPRFVDWGMGRWTQRLYRRARGTAVVPDQVHPSLTPTGQERYNHIGTR